MNAECQNLKKKKYNIKSFSSSYYSKMITEAFQDILKYVAPGQEDIVIQTVNKKLSFALNEKLETMTEALNEAYDEHLLCNN
jgi:hypothetical protein